MRYETSLIICFCVHETWMSGDRRDARFLLVLSCFTYLLTYLLAAGYRRNFNSLRDFLSTQAFAPQIELVDKEDTGVTGNFEVTFPVTGQMIHSKRTAGQGRAAIVELIQEYLDDL
jgi:hypothetical protein